MILSKHNMGWKYIQVITNRPVSKRNYNVGEINYPVFSPDLTIQESSKLDSSHPKEGNKITKFNYTVGLCE